MPPKDDWVTSKAEVRNTITYGKGLFATELIKKGEEVLRWGGDYVDFEGAQKAQQQGKLVMQFDDDLFSVEDRGESNAYFLNHSCDSNLWMRDTFTLEARKDISKNEEIAADYVLWETNENYVSKWECKCGLPNCRHRVTGKDWQLPELQDRYKNHFIPMINRRITESRKITPDFIHSANLMNPIDFSNITLPSVLNVTEQKIDISALTDEQKKFYINLFRELVELYQSKQKPRMIVGMTGPAGAGKSVITSIFQEIAKQVSLTFRFETVGIDAFHYTNDFLVANMLGGEPLKNHKGRFDTYDVDKLVTTLTQFSKGEEVSLPKYSRKTHDPVENAVTIHEQNALLLVEGLWLLYDQSGWDKVDELLDFSIFVEAEKDKVKQGVTARHMAGGRTLDDALEYYEANEAINFDLIMQTKNKADKIIPAYHGV